MKFLRTKAAIIFIVVISVLCLVAAAIAIDTSIVMIKKQDQVVKPEVTKQAKDVQAGAKPIKVSKLEEEKLYFNGQTVDGLTAFSGVEDSLFIPIDSLLKNMGAKFKYFAPDDIVEFVLNGKKVTVKLNQKEAIVGGNKVQLKFAAQAAKNHILVPGELLSYIDGFDVTRFRKEKTAFINYFPDVRKSDEQMSVLRISNGVANISDLSGSKLYWKSRDDVMGDDKVSASYKDDKYMIKALSKVYLMRDGIEKPGEISVNSSAKWSATGKYIYWLDTKSNTSYCYNVENGVTGSMGEYLLKTKSYGKNEVGKFPYENGGVLLDFIQGRRYKSIIMTNLSHSGTYAYIERRGRTVVDSPVLVSPDNKKILFYEYGKGYCTTDVNGLNKKFLGEGTSPQWINNNKVMMHGKNGMYVISKDGTGRKSTNITWKKLSETASGDVLYTDGSMLYRETGDKQAKLFRLAVSCDYIYNRDLNGAYIGVSYDKNEIYLISNGTVDIIGSSMTLIKGADVKSSKPWGNSMCTSPNSKATAIARNIEGFINLDVIDHKKHEIKSLVMNHIISDTSELDKFNMKWISDDELVVYTPDRGWLIRLGNNNNVYSWVEEKNNTIEGIFIKK